MKLLTHSLALLILSTTPLLAESIEIDVTIRSVDATARSISVRYKKKVLNLDVSRKAKITANGEAESLDNLAVGQLATINYETNLEIVTKIDATGEGATFRSLFDGKTLKGWRGDEDFWSVKDGAIVGKNSANSGEQFLSLRETFGDFVLRLQFRHLAGNSGVNFHSHAVNGDFLAGPQAEIADLKLPAHHIVYGVLYDNRGKRGVIADVPPQTKARLLASVKKDGWNDYQITVVGTHIMIEVNGITAVDIDDKEIAPSGVIGFQLHGSAATHVEFRNIEILEVEAD